MSSETFAVDGVTSARKQITNAEDDEIMSIMTNSVR